MVRAPYIIIPKSEWDRLQRQGGPPPEDSVKIDQEHLKALTELSQEWVKSWPDTLAGRLALFEKQKKKQKKLQHQANIEFIKAYNRNRLDNTATAIKRARQMIFQDSSYGRQLLSSLLESKAIDERKAQIKFRKALEEKAATLAKEEKNSKKGVIYDFHDSNAVRVQDEKKRAIECNIFNKNIVELKKEKELQEQLKEKQCAIEEETLMKQVLEIEKKEKEDIRRCEKQKLEEYEADSKNNALIKAHAQKVANAITDVYKKEQDKIKLKTQAILKEVYQGKPDTKSSKDLYEKVKQIQNAEMKSYEDFIDKGIKAYEERISEAEAKEKLEYKRKSKTKYLDAQRQMIIANEEKLAKKCVNKCACDRQSLALKSNKNPSTKSEIKTKSNESLEKNGMQKSHKICGAKAQKLPFLVPRNKLIEELRKREKEPSPWNAAKAAHAQFARQADNTLKEVKHKYFARKVVDEYRKLNYLDASTLPVPNY